MSRESLGLCEIVDRLTLTLELSNFDSDTFRIVSKFAIISKELYYKNSEKYSKSNSRTFLRRCIKITFACTWEMLTFFFAVFSFYRDIFKKRDSSLLLYVAEKDRCTVCDQFYNSVREIQCKSVCLITRYVRSNF